MSDYHLQMCVVFIQACMIIICRCLYYLSKHVWLSLADVYYLSMLVWLSLADVCITYPSLFDYHLCVLLIHACLNITCRCLYYLSKLVWLSLVGITCPSLSDYHLQLFVLNLSMLIYKWICKYLSIYTPVVTSKLSKFLVPVITFTHLLIV